MGSQTPPGPPCEVVVTREDGTQEVCGQVHVTQYGHAACPGHLRNGERNYGEDRPIGDPCRQSPGYKTEHVGTGPCWVHGGNFPWAERQGQMELARQDCDRLGIPVGDGDPIRILRDALREAEGNVAFYRRRIHEELQNKPGEITVDPDTGDLIAPPAIYGETYHVSGKRTGEAKPHVLVVLYHEAERWLAKVALEAAKFGIEQRQLELDERDADLLFTAQLAALEQMGLSERVEEFRNAFAEAIRPALGPAQLGGPAEA